MKSVPMPDELFESFASDMRELDKLLELARVDEAQALARSLAERVHDASAGLLEPVTREKLLTIARS